MKTKINIALIVLLFVSFNLSASGISKGEGTDMNPSNPVDLLYRLAPVTPVEATFDDETEMFRPVSLIPYTPEYADFDDGLPEPAASEETDLNIAPVVPAEATFDEEVTSDGYSAEFLKSIKPSVPAEADFQDLN